MTAALYRVVVAVMLLLADLPAVQAAATYDWVGWCHVTFESIAHSCVVHNTWETYDWEHCVGV